MAIMIIHNRKDLLEKAENALRARGHMCFTATTFRDARAQIGAQPNIGWSVVVSYKSPEPDSLPVAAIFVPENVMWEDTERLWRKVQDYTGGLSPI